MDVGDAKNLGGYRVITAIFFLASHLILLNRVTENTHTYTPGKLRNLIDALTEGEVQEFAKKWKKEQKTDDDASLDEELENVPIADQIDFRILSAIVNDIFGAGQDTLSSAFLFIIHYMIR